MTPDQEQALLDALGVSVQQLTERAYAELLRRLRAGETAQEALRAASGLFEGPFYTVLAGAFSEVLARQIGRAELKAWPIGDVTLSERLYDHLREVTATARKLIEDHAKGFIQARELALQLYEGYQFKVDPLQVRSALPKYLRQAMKDPGVRPVLNRLLARIQAAKLKTPGLRASYLAAIEAAEKGEGAEALAKKLKTAWYERNRYFANRIAQTELHRAYSDVVARELMADEALEWVQVRLSLSHDHPCICDLNARLDAYGQGAGVYPKLRAPKPAFHPFCRCLTLPRPDLRADPTKPPKPDAERKFLANLDPDEARRIAGSRAKRDAILAGEDWLKVMQANVPVAYKLMRVGEVEALD